MFDLSRLTPNQRRISEDALRRCRFDWTRLAPGLRAKTGRTQIPVDWSDLSRYGGTASRGAGGHEDHDHKPHGIHVEEAGDTAHGIEWRHQVLGLAWYSGRISIERTLEDRPALAAEVLLSEGAHMADFFWLTDEQRARIYGIFHAGSRAPHPGHAWFDSPRYWDDVGEAFMGGFVAAYSDVPVTLTGFSHRVTIYTGPDIRAALEGSTYWGVPWSSLYHKRPHGRGNWQEISPAGRRPCRVCRP